MWSSCLPTVLACNSYSRSVLDVESSLGSCLILKSVVIIATTREDQNRNFPFYLANTVLSLVNDVKYLGHILKSDICDDDDDVK